MPQGTYLAKLSRQLDAALHTQTTAGPWPRASSGANWRRLTHPKESSKPGLRRWPLFKYWGPDIK